MRRTEKSGQEVIRVMIVRGKLGRETLEDKKEKEIQVSYVGRHPNSDYIFTRSNLPRLDLLG